MKKILSSLTVLALLLSFVAVPVNFAAAEEGDSAPDTSVSSDTTSSPESAPSEEAEEAPVDEPAETPTEESEEGDETPVVPPAEEPAPEVITPDPTDETVTPEEGDTTEEGSEEAEEGGETSLRSMMVESFSLVAEDPIPQCTEEQSEIATLQAFFDDFAAGFGSWTKGSRWSATTGSNKAAKVAINCFFAFCDSNISGPAGRLTTSTSTEDYSDVVLSFQYSIAKPLESSDHFFAEWSADGTTWEEVSGFHLTNQNAPTTLTTVALPLPEGAEDLADLKIRFQANFTANTNQSGVEPQYGDEVRIDNVLIEGDKRVCEVPETPVDICENVPGLQTEMPDGYEAGEVEGQCVAIPDPDPVTLKVHILKYVDGQMATSGPETGYPMQSTWQTANLNEGATSTGSYILGDFHGGNVNQYGADTSAMEAPAYYTTHELTTNEQEGGPVLPADAQCSANTYRLAGYSVGDTLEMAEEAVQSTTTPEFYGLNADKYVIVWNDDCDTVLAEEEPVPPVETPDDSSNGGGGGSSGGGCRAGSPCDRSNDDGNEGNTGDGTGNPIVTPAGLTALNNPGGNGAGGAFGQGGTEGGDLASADTEAGDVVGMATTTTTGTTTAVSTTTDTNNLDQAAALGALDLFGFKWYWWLLLILILIAIGYYTLKNKEDQY